MRNELVTGDQPFALPNSLFGRKKFRVPNRTGNLPQRIGIAGRIDRTLAQKGPRWPELEKFPVIFPVGRESERAPNRQNPVLLRYLWASMISRSGAGHDSRQI